MLEEAGQIIPDSTQRAEAECQLEELVFRSMFGPVEKKDWTKQTGASARLFGPMFDAYSTKDWPNQHIE
jgi:hypothetical protein